MENTVTEWLCRIADSGKLPLKHETDLIEKIGSVFMFALNEDENSPVWKNKSPYGLLRI